MCHRVVSTAIRNLLIVTHCVCSPFTSLPLLNERACTFGMYGGRPNGRAFQCLSHVRVLSMAAIYPAPGSMTYNYPRLRTNADKCASDVYDANIVGPERTLEAVVTAYCLKPLKDRSIASRHVVGVWLKQDRRVRMLWAAVANVLNAAWPHGCDGPQDRRTAECFHLLGDVAVS